MEKEQMGLVVEQGGGKSSEEEIYEVRKTSKQNDAWLHRKSLKSGLDRDSSPINEIVSSFTCPHVTGQKTIRNFFPCSFKSLSHWVEFVNRSCLICELIIQIKSTKTSQFKRQICSQVSYRLYSHELLWMCQGELERTSKVSVKMFYTILFLTQSYLMPNNIAFRLMWSPFRSLKAPVPWWWWVGGGGGGWVVGGGGKDEERK